MPGPTVASYGLSAVGDGGHHVTHEILSEIVLTSLDHGTHVGVKAGVKTSLPRLLCGPDQARKCALCITKLVLPTEKFQLVSRRRETASTVDVLPLLEYSGDVLHAWTIESRGGRRGVPVSSIILSVGLVRRPQVPKK